MIVVSSTEPAVIINSLRRHFNDPEDVVASTQPEHRGVDFLWRAHGEWHGIQRKEVRDFIASVNDGRLAKEVGQMRDGVVRPHLVIEGKVMFINGELGLGGKFGKPVKRAAWRGMLWSLAAQGIEIGYTHDHGDTAEYVAHAYAWSQKDSHSTGLSRPGPDSEWGTPTSRDFQIHLLMGMPGVGRELAERVITHFGGLPWEWAVTPAALMEVPGLGKKKVDTMWKALAYITKGGVTDVPRSISTQVGDS